MKNYYFWLKKTKKIYLFRFVMDCRNFFRSSWIIDSFFKTITVFQWKFIQDFITNLKITLEVALSKKFCVPLVESFGEGLSGSNAAFLCPITNIQIRAGFEFLFWSENKLINLLEIDKKINNERGKIESNMIRCAKCSEGNRVMMRQLEAENSWWKRVNIGEFKGGTEEKFHN